MDRLSMSQKCTPQKHHKPKMESTMNKRQTRRAPAKINPQRIARTREAPQRKEKAPQRPINPVVHGQDRGVHHFPNQKPAPSAYSARYDCNTLQMTIHHASVDMSAIEAGATLSDQIHRPRKLPHRFSCRGRTRPAAKSPLGRNLLSPYIPGRKTKKSVVRITQAPLRPPPSRGKYRCGSVTFFFFSV